MHILMVSPICPWPANTGGLVRILEIAKGLAQHFAITLIVPVSQMGEDLPSGEIPGLRVVPIPVRPASLIRRAGALISLRPYHNVIYQSSALSRSVALEYATGQYHAIYCHFAYSLQYLPRETALPIILDPHNVDDDLWRSKVKSASGVMRLIYAWNWLKVVRYERSWLPRLWAYVCVCQEDRVRTQNYAQPWVSHFFVAPNGVDVEKYTPIEWNNRMHSSLITVAFLGSLDLKSNACAAHRLATKIIPRARSLLPNSQMRLVIVGRHPPAELQALAQGDPNVEVTGTVPDIRPWLRKADIFAAPLTEGAGTKLRVVEAMATGLPVVGTDLALRGLKGQDGVHYLRANDDDSFARCVATLGASLPQRAKMGMRARQLVEENFTWGRITACLANELEAALKDAHERSGSGARANPA